MLTQQRLDRIQMDGCNPGALNHLCLGGPQLRCILPADTMDIQILRLANSLNLRILDH